MLYTGFKRAEYGISILSGAPQDYVNTYSTPRLLGGSVSLNDEWYLWTEHNQRWRWCVCAVVGCEIP